MLDAIEPLIDALGAAKVDPEAAIDTDVVLRWDGAPVVAVRLPDLNGALDRVVKDVERELGCPLADLDRSARLHAIRSLEDRGAFTLRRAVEHIAEQMAVSRFTVYNYLNADRESDRDVVEN